MSARVLLLVPILGWLACAGGQHPAEVNTSSARLRELSARYWNANLQSAPLYWIGDALGSGTQNNGPLVATLLGDHRFDDQLDDLSSAGRQRFLDAISTMEAEAKTIPEAELSHEERLTRALLIDLIDVTREIQVCDADRWTVDQMGGPQISLPLTAAYYPLATEKGVLDLVLRFKQVVRYFDEQIASLREGMAKGEVSPKRNVKLTIDELDELLKKDGAHSDFLPPAEKLEKLPAEQRVKVLTLLAAAIDSSVIPGLRRYRDFLTNELMPRARTDPGVWALPNGEACYAAAIRMHTDLRLTPKEVHEEGVALLAKIEAEERVIARSEGAPLKADGSPDLKAFEKSVGQRPGQFYTNGDDLLDWARRTVARAMAALPADFRTMPQRPLEVKAIEAWRAASVGSAYYQPAADDGQTPAYYYVNTTNPQTRTLYDQECTVFHEGVPGHHLQTSIAQSLTGLPAFRRYGVSTGYTEGWALYTERLGDELHLYSSPLARYGMLAGQALRAVRLIVDTGLHAMHWTRDQALAFYLAHTTDDPAGGASEIDRYIIWPGQALGYMVGEQEIFRLRDEASSRLGAAFDIREFHDVILLHGALPLPILEEEVHRWEESKGAGASAR